MLLLRKQSSTSNVLRAMLRNSTTGQGLTGLSSASSGLIISTVCDNESAATTYSVAGSTVESITTLGTFAAPTSTKIRFKEVDATNHPGLYEFQIADARFAVASSRTLRISISGASGLLAKSVVIQLTAVDPDSATAFVTSVPIDLTQALPSTPTANSTGEALFIADNLAGRINTAQAGASATITLDAGSSSTDGRYVGYGVYLYGGTGGGIRGVGQERTITGYVGSTKVATVAQAWGTNPDNTTKFMLYTQPWANVGIWNGTVVSTPATAGVPDVNAKAINNVSTSPVTTIAANLGSSQALTFNANNFLKVGVNDVLGTMLTEGAAGRLAAGIVQFFNVATPTSTMNVVTNLTNAPSNGDFTAAMKTSLNAATPVSVGDVTGKVLGGGSGTITGSGIWALSGSGAALAVAGTALSTAQWTNTRAASLDNLDASVSSRSTYAGGAVASVTGNVGGSVASVVGSVGSLTGYVAPDNTNIGIAASAAVSAATSAATAATQATTAATNTGTILSSGVDLKSTGLDAIPITDVASPAGVTTFPRQVRWLYQAIAFKAVLDKVNSLFKRYGADNTTVVSTQTATSDDSAETLGKAS